MFIPLKDENPTSGKTYVTIALIAINVLIFFWTYLRGMQGFQIITYQFGMIPSEIMQGIELTPQFSSPIYFTPFSSMFMHGGIMHLAGNMLYLWIFGNNIEDHVGSVKFIIFYLVSGLAAAFLFIVFSPDSEIPMVGASGAIAGVMGAYLVLYPKAKIMTLLFLFYFIRIIRVPAVVVLGFWFVYQLFMSMASGGGGGVAWLAHVGGFAFGWVWFKIFNLKRKNRPVVY